LSAANIYIYGVLKKYILDLRLSVVEHVGERCVLLKAANPCAPLPPMVPGQFAQLRVEESPQTFLRRPISIHWVDSEKNEVWFLVQTVGHGTQALARLHPGSTLNAVLPLGRGFTMSRGKSEEVLLVGGGVGVAPLLWLGQKLLEDGSVPTFLLGARSVSDLLQLERFKAIGQVCVTTEDGSEGERGFVTQHSILGSKRFARICSCGPLPMMKAVARYAREEGIPCEVSLENMMACGVGACLCCVEDTTEGNVCVCTEGPVFNIDRLKW